MPDGYLGVCVGICIEIITVFGVYVRMGEEGVRQDITDRIMSTITMPMTSRFNAGYL